MTNEPDASLMTNHERRKSHRHAATIGIQFRTVGDAQIETVRDISRTGLFVSCKEPLPLNTLLHVQLFPGEETAPVLDATVVRVVWGGWKNGETTEPGMALSFPPLSEDAYQRITQLAETVAADSESGLSGSKE